MNAIDLLKEDHRAVEELFKRVEDTPPSKHPAIFKRIKNELDTHAHIEEKVFYPILKEDGDKELVDITLEGIEEHAQIKKFLREIARTTSKDTREAKLKVLIEDTRHHVKEEEKEMFPMTEDQFTSEQLEKIGEKMEAERKKYQKAKKITPRPAPPKGTVATVIEKAKKLVTSALTGNGATKPTPSKAKAASGNGKARTSSAAKKSPSKATSAKKKTAPARATAAKKAASTKRSPSKTRAAKAAR